MRLFLEPGLGNNFLSKVEFIGVLFYYEEMNRRVVDFLKKLPGLAVIVVAGTISYSVVADSINTQVTVSNSAPTFSVAPAESPASDTTTPTNVGNVVTFQATATDANNDSYRLAICKTNAVTPNGVGSPTCDGGSWCVSSTAASGAQASCTYTALSGDVESNDWYAFVCDSTTGSTCSSSSQGSGSSGSPFAVNHTPAFTAMNSTAGDPGATITFTATASDADTSGSADTVLLVVCSASGATASGCTIPANQLCISTAVSSNPTCDYTLPAVKNSGTTSYYSYVYDSHNLGATNNPFPSKSYTTNNVSPSVSNVVVNGAADITLTAGTTTNVTVTGTITDANSCQNISSVKTSLYRSGVGYSACDTVGELNYNYCYSLVTCSVSGGSCTGGTDASADYSCTVTMQYHTDPTDVSTVYSAENWLGTILVTDSGALTATAESSTPIEVASLTALSLDALVSYGNIGLGQDSGATNATTTVTALGNVGIDTELSGTSMTNGTDTIPVANQKYGTTAFTYSSGGTALSTTPVEIELNVLKTTSVGTPATKSLYWGIAIPGSISFGTYTGTNNITAIKGESNEW